MWEPKFFVLLVMVFIFSGCSESVFVNDGSIRTTIVPPDGFVSDVTKGEKLYALYCEKCHGLQGKGTEVAPALVHPDYAPRHHPNLSFFLAVRKGKKAVKSEYGGMPAMPQVSAEEAAHIVAYIRKKQFRANIFKNVYVENGTSMVGDIQMTKK